MPARAALSLLFVALFCLPLSAVEAPALLPADTLAYLRIRDLGSRWDQVGRLPILRPEAKTEALLAEARKLFFEEMEEETGITGQALLSAYQSIGDVHIGLLGINLQGGAPSMAALVHTKDSEALKALLDHEGLAEARQPVTEYKGVELHLLELDRDLQLHWTFLNDQQLLIALDQGTLRDLVVAAQDGGGALSLKAVKHYGELEEALGDQDLFFYGNPRTFLRRLRTGLKKRDLEELDAIDAIFDLGALQAVGLGTSWGAEAPATHLRLVTREHRILALTASSPFDADLLKVVPAELGVGFGGRFPEPARRWEQLREFIVEREKTVLDDNDFETAVAPARARRELGMAAEEAVAWLEGSFFLCWPTLEGFDDDNFLLVARATSPDSARALAQALARAQRLKPHEHRGVPFWSKSLEQNNHPEAVAALGDLVLFSGNGRLLQRCIDLSRGEGGLSALDGAGPHLEALGSLHKVGLMAPSLVADLERELYHVLPLVGEDGLLVAGTRKDGPQHLELVLNHGALDALAVGALSALRYEYYRDAVSQTREALSQVGAALEAYRAAHGVYPESLEALVPDYLPDEAALRAPAGEQLPWRYEAGLRLYEGIHGMGFTHLHYQDSHCLPVYVETGETSAHTSRWGSYQRMLARTGRMAGQLKALVQLDPATLEERLVDAWYQEPAWAELVQISSILLRRQPENVRGLAYRGWALHVVDPDRGAIPALRKAYELARAAGDADLLLEVRLLRVQAEAAGVGDPEWAAQELAKLEAVEPPRHLTAMYHRILANVQGQSGNQVLHHYEQLAHFLRTVVPSASAPSLPSELAPLMVGELLALANGLAAAEAWEALGPVAEELLRRELLDGHLYHGLAALAARDLTRALEHANVLAEEEEGWVDYRLQSRALQLRCRILLELGRRDAAMADEQRVSGHYGELNEKLAYRQAALALGLASKSRWMVEDHYRELISTLWPYYVKARN